MKPREILTKEFLQIEYVEKKKPSDQIARENNIKSHHSVDMYIKKFGLTREHLKSGAKKLTIENLQRLYIQEQKNVLEIASEIQTSAKTVTKKLKEYGLFQNRPRITKKIYDSLKDRRRGYNGITGIYWRTVVNGASRRNMLFDVTIEYCWNLFILQDGKCALTGIPITFYDVGESAKKQTASLDRIDSKLGYIEGNLQWIHKEVNRLKSNFDENDFIDWCRKVVNYADSKIWR